MYWFQALSSWLSAPSCLETVSPKPGVALGGHSEDVLDPRIVYASLVCYLSDDKDGGDAGDGNDDNEFSKSYGSYIKRGRISRGHPVYLLASC